LVIIIGASDGSSSVGDNIAVGLSGWRVTASENALDLAPGKIIGRSRYDELGVNIVGKG